MPSAASPAGASAKPRGWPLLRLGFRPFYLAAASFALLAIPLWIAMFLGWFAPEIGIAPVLW
ncbi:MAG: NnrS family protein, partial [Gemmatimonadales bacterium]|nr:NnrS family protein [Gemmatimonadales bacterium]